MSIETAAKDLAYELSRQSSVDILCHHDADGIAAGSIMAMALYRAGIPFRLRITHRLSEDNLPKTRPLLLCDLGAGIAGLPEDTMVIDHHLPLFEGSHHVNPRLDGIDGDKELCAAGTAYLVANELGDNRDLAGLPLLGIIGDEQTLTGRNQEIYLDALANGIISKKRGITLPGRTPAEQIELAAEPFLQGISGSQEESLRIIHASTTGDTLQIDILCSLLVLHAAEICRPEAMDSLWGDIWVLEREVIENAHNMAFVVDSCGKAGHGSIAVSLCLRSSGLIEKAYEIARAHRLSLIQEMNRVLTKPPDKHMGPIMCSDMHLVSDLADIVFKNIPYRSPVIVAVQKNDGTCSCSVRTDGNNGRFAGEIVHQLACEYGGYGGGHQNRAGATISCENLNKFSQGIVEAFSS
ncbi:MAG TPA: DHHA1 domain-containing protein [Methanospirillum sp.]|uniref:DHHA1 domain-containing protein n=1 Tax=Methanospirillum sp. TaxID=45200 RepID=UPI002C1743DB|nr:DHHA1 domain-containing protein [Methanospirillum sp.]HOJ96481.1 DHHA1 domain-containing protein [Methanospirillum sp.]HPP77696.1 DHHA1 domain-containing protein [Methanospirillum sp.]